MELVMFHLRKENFLYLNSYKSKTNEGSSPNDKSFFPRDIHSGMQFSVLISNVEVVRTPTFGISAKSCLQSCMFRRKKTIHHLGDFPRKQRLIINMKLHIPNSLQKPVQTFSILPSLIYSI